MSDATAEPDPKQAGKPSRLPILIGLVLALAGGGGGYFAVSSGFFESGHDAPVAHDAHAIDVETAPAAHVSFVEVPPLVISLDPGGPASHLRFRASLEVPRAHAAEIEALTPRVQDVFNTYLGALDSDAIEAPGALVRIRGQLLRRVQLVAGQDRINDLLVLEFVLN